MRNQSVQPDVESQIEETTPKLPNWKIAMSFQSGFNPMEPYRLIVFRS